MFCSASYTLRLVPEFREVPTVVRFFLFLCSLIFISAGSAAEKLAATVNGDSITLPELEAALAQLPPPTMPMSDLQKRQQRADALHVLIDDRLVRQFLKEHGPKVAAVEVERQFAALEVSQKAEGKSVEAYLKEIGLTANQVKENFALMLSLAKHVEKAATDERLREYYEQTRDLFNRTTVRASHIVLRIGSTATEVEKEKARAKLRSIRAELASGRVEFAAAAKAHSQCPSGPNGGDLGFIARKFQVDEAFARTAFALKVGEVSDIVETEAGYHLIWLTERKEGKPTKYEDVTADVRECYEAEVKQNLLSHLRKNAKIVVPK